MRNAAETVEAISTSEISDFEQHPFLVRNDEMMQQLTESIRQVGVLTPVLVRKMPDGHYQMISGHRRKYACDRLGIEILPAIVRTMDQEEATVTMVDSNLQREVILPSEKARAYKMKLEVYKRQGKRTDLTSDQPDPKSKRKTARDRVAENSPDSATQIRRFIRLNDLIPEILDMVDAGKIALTPAVEISYLSKAEQECLLLTMDCEQATPSLSQALRMKILSAEGKLTEDLIMEIMEEQKKPECWNLTLPMNKLTGYFPSSYTPQKIQETILQLLDAWSKQVQNQMNGGRRYE